MDLFEEIVRMRRAGQRGALATIVYTNGSIPGYESSRMLVREDGSIEGAVVAIAIFDATGARLRHLPMTPAHLTAALLQG